ncbi:MAG: sigma-70 family RNA polymerase sigma factor [Candidatus Scalinduaceae bacterium]
MLELDDLKSLLSLCCKGDIQAIRTFQDIFGEDIYNFPIKVHKLDEERAADFYCYCFEKDRIYKRFITFRGECKIRSFQFLILDHLFKEWIRKPDVEMSIYSIDFPLQGNEGVGEMVMRDILKDPISTTKEEIEEKEDLRKIEVAIKRLDDDERIYLNLLSFSEIDIESEDIRVISRISGRNLQETTENIFNLEESLSKRYELYKKKREELDKINYWILIYEKHIKKLKNNKFKSTIEVEQLVINKNELERKVLWRKKQKEKLLKKYRESSPKVSYREIAKLLNVSVGTVSSKIKNARARLNEILNDLQNREQQIS